MVDAHKTKDMFAVESRGVTGFPNFTADQLEPHDLYLHQMRFYWTQVENRSHLKMWMCYQHYGIFGLRELGKLQKAGMMMMMKLVEHIYCNISSSILQKAYEALVD